MQLLQRPLKSSPLAEIKLYSLFLSHLWGRHFFTLLPFTSWHREIQHHLYFVCDGITATATTSLHQLEFDEDGPEDGTTEDEGETVRRLIWIIFKWSHNQVYGTQEHNDWEKDEHFVWTLAFWLPNTEPDECSHGGSIKCPGGEVEVVN